jgi:hypothetical protein
LHIATPATPQCQEKCFKERLHLANSSHVIIIERTL